MALFNPALVGNLMYGGGNVTSSVTSPAEELPSLSTPNTELSEMMRLAYYLNLK